MKDILKMMRFDFISCLGTSGTAGTATTVFGVILIVFFLAFGFFISPVFAFTFIAVAGALIVPLQSAKKDDLGRLYGVLPIKRRNITRARFLYIYLLHIVGFVIALLLAFTSVSLDLNRFLPHDNEMMRIFSEEFNMTEFAKLITVAAAFTVFSCLMFAFMEMMGQILGREHEMKIFIIILIVIVVGIMGGVWVLGQLGSPEIKLPEMPQWASLTVTGAVTLGICVLFGEITAAKLAKREL